MQWAPKIVARRIEAQRRQQRPRHHSSRYDAERERDQQRPVEHALRPTTAAAQAFTAHHNMGNHEHEDARPKIFVKGTPVNAGFAATK